MKGQVFERAESFIASDQALETVKIHLVNIRIETPVVVEEPLKLWMENSSILQANNAP